jgi:hypothetical protein
VVGEPGERVAVHEHLGGGGNAVVVVEGAGVEDEAVGDAAVVGELFASTAFDLEGGGAAGADVPHEQPGEQDDGESEGGEQAWVCVLQVLAGSAQQVEYDLEKGPHVAMKQA